MDRRHSSRQGAQESRPRGRRYVAKRGPVLLARNEKLPVLAFLCAVEQAWVLNSWDRFIIPKPFSRVALRLRRAADGWEKSL